MSSLPRSARVWTVALVGLLGCTSSMPSDRLDASGRDAPSLDSPALVERDVPWMYPDVRYPDVPQPTDRPPPVVDCGSDGDTIDAGWADDPWCHYVTVCADGWASVYSGTCGPDGHCVFEEPVTWDYCELGCSALDEGRCTKPALTAP